MKHRDAGLTRVVDGAKGSQALAEVSLLLAVFFVGMDVVSVKYALEGLPSLVFMPLRYVLAGLLLLAALRLLGQTVAIVPRDLPALAGLGLVGVALNQVGYTVGLSLTSGSNASLVFATAPVWGLLLGVSLGLERSSWTGALGIAMAIVGVALVVGGGLGSEEASLGGDLLVCVSAFSWGAYAVLSLPVLRRFDPLPVAGWTMLLGGFAVLPLAFTGFPGLSDPVSSVAWGSVGATSLAAAAYSTVLASSFAIAAWQVNVSRLGANKVLVYLYLVSLVGLVASVVLLGENLGAAKVAGAAVILLGVFLARRA
ncbi:MAG TPA: DMT family transporter [Rubrobacter sp.]|nr:DMT family transporter [Rubrobacter sp.]